MKFIRTVEGLSLVTAALLLTMGCRAADWPQFLGPARNGVYQENDLGRAWPKEGPPKVWQVTVGQGFSGPAVAGNRLIAFHRLQDKEVIDCLDAASGARQWRFEYPTSYRDDFGFDEGPRATPTIDHERVYTFGAEGHLHCLDLHTGTNVWNVQTKEQFQAQKGFFGIACSPLVIDGKVLLNVGGANGAGIVAFDAPSGRVLWQATDDEASYSSPVAAALNGQPRVVFFTRSRVLALDPANGAIQWQFPWRSRSHASVNAATPLIVGDFIFASASYETGAVLLKSGAASVTRVWSSDDALSNHYATSVQRDGFVYGFHGRQEYGPSLRCIELQTGKVRWNQDRFGAGSILLAGDQLLVLKEDGMLLAVAASPKGYHELNRAQILPKGVRAYPAVANGYLFARSKDQLVCLDLRRQ